MRHWATLPHPGWALHCTSRTAVLKGPPGDSSQRTWEVTLVSREFPLEELAFLLQKLNMFPRSRPWREKLSHRYLPTTTPSSPNHRDVIACFTRQFRDISQASAYWCNPGTPWSGFPNHHPRLQVCWNSHPTSNWEIREARSGQSTCPFFSEYL